jgi:hypothetical protein
MVLLSVAHFSKKAGNPPAGGLASTLASNATGPPQRFK